MRNNDSIDDQEENLNKNIDQMKKAIHHVELNQKLNECFDLLDVITKTYRNFSTNYCQIVEDYPNVLENFYEKFERNWAEWFKWYGEDKREEIQILFQKETEERQRKLEEGALKKYEEEKKQEELKAKEEDDKNKGAKKAPPKAPPKKGKDADKPDLNVPQLEVPKIKEVTSSNGYKYLVKRTIDEIASELMIIKSEESEAPKTQENPEGEQKVDKPPEGKPADNKQPAAQAQAQPPPAEQKKEEEEGEGDHSEEKVVVNKYLENIRQMPPVDPDGNQVLVPNLIIQHNEIKELIQSFFDKMFNWISKHKGEYFKQTKVKNKELVDNNIIELDENLRAQWPRKGKLEVEVYQERKSQITAHNK